MTIFYGGRLADNLPKQAEGLIKTNISLEKVFDFCLFFYGLDKNKETAIKELLKHSIAKNDYSLISDLIKSLLAVLVYIEEDFKREKDLQPLNLPTNDNGFDEKLKNFQNSVTSVSEDILSQGNIDLKKSVCLFFFGLDHAKKLLLRKLIQKAIKDNKLFKLAEIVNTIFCILDYIGDESLKLCDSDSKRELIKGVFTCNEVEKATETRNRIFNDIKKILGNNNKLIRCGWYSKLRVITPNPPLKERLIEQRKQVKKPTAAVQNKTSDPPPNKSSLNIGKIATSQTFIKSDDPAVVPTEQIVEQSKELLILAEPEVGSDSVAEKVEEPIGLVESADVSPKITTKKVNASNLADTKIISFKDFSEGDKKGNKTKKSEQSLVDESSQQILIRLEKIGILLDGIFISNKNASRTIEKMDAFIALFEENKSIKNPEIAEINNQISDMGRKLNMVIDLLKSGHRGGYYGVRKISQPYKYIRVEDIPEGATLLEEGERHQKCHMPFTKWGWDRSKLKKQQEGKYRYTKVEELPEGATLLKEGERHGKCSQPQRKRGRKNGSMIKVQEVTIDLNNQSVAIVPQTT